jgi:hypothetical protein
MAAHRRGWTSEEGPGVVFWTAFAGIVIGAWLAVAV